MKQSASLPKYRQPQLNHNLSLAEQASGALSRSTEPLARGAGKPRAGKLVPISEPRSRVASRASGILPEPSLATVLAALCIVCIGVALGVPLGAWLYLRGQP